MPRSIHAPLNYSQTFTFAQADANGYADDVAYSGGGFALTASGPGDDCAHLVTILGNAVTDHSGKTFTLTGTNADDVVTTETLAGPNGVATVTSTLYYKTLTSVTVGSTTGADTFDIGWTAPAKTPWVPLDHLQLPFSMAYAVIVVSGSVTYATDLTHEDFTSISLLGYLTGLGSGSTTREGARSVPAKGVRVNAAAQTDGVIRFVVLQGARR